MVDKGVGIVGKDWYVNLIKLAELKKIGVDWSESERSLTIF